MSKHDEDSDDKLLDEAGKFVGKSGAICRHKWRDHHGIWRVCTKRKGHWGAHKQ